MHTSFETEYKRLNKEQKKAVDAIEGPVMVVAGPGTGKTQILTLRIANILRLTDTSPDTILALTFTESGVASMRKRLADMIGSSAYAVEINTFHTFANDIIRNNPEHFPHIIGSKSITEIKQIGLVEEIVTEAKDIEILKPFGDPLYYIRAIVGAISDLKREGVSVEDFQHIVRKKEKEFSNISDLYYEEGAHKGKMRGKYKDIEKQIAKNKELAYIYEAYQHALQEQKLYDFDDMIVETLVALKRDHDLLLRLEEQYQYVLVDEHQDTNNAQNKILELLASFHAPHPNLFVVGDEKQAIFRFQGASLENFYYFKHLYPEALLITLKENYRSSQTILDSAHSLLAGEVPLKGNQKFEEKQIELYSFSKEQVETFFIREDIQRKIDAGIPPHEIAVLYRDNKDAFLLASMLEKANIPFRIESDQDIFSHAVIRKFLIILDAVRDYGNDRKLADMLHLDVSEVAPLDVFKVVRSASQKRKYNLYDILHDDAMLREAHVADADKIKAIAEKLAAWVTQSKNVDFTVFLERVLTDSGLLSQVLSSPHAQEELDVIDSFFDEVKNIVLLDPSAGLSEFFAYLNTVRSHNVYIKKRTISGREGFVRLMTAHRSKGLEFEYVYLIHARNGKWGNKKQRELLPLIPEVYALFETRGVESGDEDAESDERRLFYVAITRAKKQVIVTYARENEEGKEQIPSQFIGEINEQYITVVDTSVIEQEFEMRRGDIIQEVRRKNGHNLKNKEFVADIFKKQGLSVTALNNYVSCPWKYFYRNLLRLPEPIEPHLMFGTAVHDTLEHLFKKLRVDESISKASLLSYFSEKLGTFPLKASDQQVYEKRGIEALSGWFDAYSERWITHTLTELPIRGIVLTPEIMLTGKVDKLEFLSESEVNVVDYKTGKPKTRNTILGNTKIGDGGLWRQIVFYKLLLNHYKDGVYNMVSAEIDFVEPQANGEYRKEKFIVEDADVEDLIEIIKQTAEEILSLSFWDKRCDEKDCEYCALRDLMRE